MKYALFVLALLLVVFGCYAVYSGSQVIEVERGWSSVIAGTTIAVGGILLFGLAWIIKTLERLGAMLQTAGAEAAIAPALKLAREAESEPAERKAVRPPVPPAPSAAVAWPPHTSSAVAEKEDEDLAAQELDAAPAEELRDSVDYASFEAEANTILNTPFTEETARLAARAKPDKSSAAVRDFWRRAVKDPDREEPPARAFLKAKSEVPAEKPMRPKPPLRPVPRPKEDERSFEPLPESPTGAREWLERTFPGREEPHADDIGNEFGEELEAFREPTQKEPPPPLVGEPPASEVEAAEEPAVIGRYDAEGTCYTMFADGSIEAQSERGVFRFRSMEELKAYFETLREPQ